MQQMTDRPKKRVIKAAAVAVDAATAIDAAETKRMKMPIDAKNELCCHICGKKFSRQSKHFDKHKAICAYTHGNMREDVIPIEIVSVMMRQMQKQINTLQDTINAMAKCPMQKEQLARQKKSILQWITNTKEPVCKYSEIVSQFCEITENDIHYILHAGQMEAFEYLLLAKLEQHSNELPIVVDAESTDFNNWYIFDFVESELISIDAKQRTIPNAPELTVPIRWQKVSNSSETWNILINSLRRKIAHALNSYCQLLNKAHVDQYIIEQTMSKMRDYSSDVTNAQRLLNLRKKFFGKIKQIMFYVGDDNEDNDCVDATT